MDESIALGDERRKLNGNAFPWPGSWCVHDEYQFEPALEMGQETSHKVELSVPRGRVLVFLPNFETLTLVH